MQLYEKIEAVRDAIYAVILAGMDDLSTPINCVMFDDEIKTGTIKPPYLKIISEDSEVGANTTGGREEWLLRYSLLIVSTSVKSGDAKEAQKLALECSTLFLTDRTLGRVISDIYRVGFTPNDKRDEDASQISGASVQMTALINFKEGDN